MRLLELVAGADLAGLGLLRELRGDPAIEITGVTMDSRQVVPGSLFACVPGIHSDGHAYAPSAIADGAAALMCERVLDLPVAQLVVSSVRRSLGPVCHIAAGRPSERLTVVGVTGTNGKTTTCSFLASIFEARGWRTATIGTLTQQRTTPEAPELQAMLAEWIGEGGRAVAMEVSSHALDQHRTDAVHYAAAVFTNLTPEHLDYHKTMESYFAAKARLFLPGGADLAVVNESDEWGHRLARLVTDAGGSLVTFSESDAGDLELHPGWSEFTWEGRGVRIRLPGRFNIMNAVAAASCAMALGVAIPEIVAGLEAVSEVEGRFQMVDAGQPFTVVVDYAHTPDGLAKVLTAAREICAGRLIVVFGAGGDRDHEKRPMMGSAAAKIADLAVITSDNPRNEDPGAIISEVLSGVADLSNVSEMADRRSAIEAALTIAQSGDVVVIAGKGHEKGQEVGGRVLPFDDVEVATASLRRIIDSRQAGAR